MKRNILIGIIVAIIVIGGGFLLFNKSSTTPAKTSSSSSDTTVSNSPNKPVDVNNAVLVTKTNASVGTYLADPSGNTLYVYAKDTNGVSNCTGSCIAAWPAYQDKGSTTGLPTNVGVITRTDNGQIQYTYKGLPLYTFTGDSVGQVTGNGVSDFQVVKP